MVVIVESPRPDLRHGKLPLVKFQHHFDHPVVGVVGQDMAGAILGIEGDLIGKVGREDLDLAGATRSALQALAGWIEEIANEDIGIGGGIDLKGVALPETVESDIDRSEERRVGKECRSRWSP